MELSRGPLAQAGGQDADFKDPDPLAFGSRLDRTAKSLPKDFIGRSKMNLKERFRKPLEAKGGLFEEGGRKKTRAR